MHSLWGYVGKIRVNPRFEQVKILVIGDLFPQRSVSWKEAAQVELKPHRCDTKGMRVVRESSRKLATFCRRLRGCRVENNNNNTQGCRDTFQLYRGWKVKTVQLQVQIQQQYSIFGLIWLL